MTENDAPRATLLRALGLGTAMAVVVGNVIGSGIFAKPGEIAATGGGFPLIIAAWITGGVLCLLGALCFAELATMFPQAGGLYVYLREAYGKTAAFLFGWNELFLNRPGSIGALGTFFVLSLAAATGWQAGVWGQVPLVVGLIVLMAWINILGVVWGGRVQVATTVVKAAGVALVAVAPFAVYLANGGGIDPANYSSTLSEAASENATGNYAIDSAAERSFPMRFGLVLLAVMWAYNGWHGVTPVAEEIRDPQRNIPLALFGGIGILIVLYVSANVAYHGVLPLNEIAAAGEGAAHAVAGQLAGGIGVAVITGIILCSTFGAINANLLLAPRVAFALGRDGLFFRQLGQVHVNYRTPAVAIVVQSTMAVLLVVASGFLTSYVSQATWQRINAAIQTEDAELRERITTAIAGRQRGLTQQVKKAIAKQDQETQARILHNIRHEDTVVRSSWLRETVVLLEDKTIFELLTNFVIFAGSIFYALCVLAVFILRHKRPDLPRPYRTWGYPLTPLLFLIFYAAFLTIVFIGEPFEALAGLTLIALALPVHWWWQRKK